MNKFKSIMAVAGGVLAGMAAGIILSNRRQQLTVNIRDSRGSDTVSSVKK